MDTCVWGRGHWDLLALCANAADHEESMRPVAHQVMQCFMQTLPCETCRCFYRNCLITMMQRMQSTRHTSSLTRFVFHLKCIVDAKITPRRTQNPRRSSHIAP